MLKKNVLRTGLEWLYKWLFVIQSVCMYASVATIVVTVVMREVFRVSLVWGYEIACWFVIILVFTAMPENLYRKTNISVSIVYDVSPKPVRKALGLIHYLVEVAALVMMAVGFRIWITRVGHGIMVASGMSNIAYYGVLGVGVGLSLLEMFVEIIDLFVKKDPAAIPEEEHEMTVMEMLEQEAEEKVREAEEAETDIATPEYGNEQENEQEKGDKE